MQQCLSSPRFLKIASVFLSPWSLRRWIHLIGLLHTLFIFFLLCVERSLDNHTSRFIQYGVEDNTMRILKCRMTTACQLLHHSRGFLYINDYVYAD